MAGYQQCLDVLDAAVEAAEESRFALKPTAPTVSRADSSQRLSRWMDYVESVLRSIGGSVASLAAGPKLDLCLIQQLEERVNALWSELRTIRKEILSMSEIESSLLDRALAIEKSLDGQGLSIKRLLQQQPSSPKVLDKFSVPDEGTVKNTSSMLLRSMATF